MQDRHLQLASVAVALLGIASLSFLSAVLPLEGPGLSDQDGRVIRVEGNVLRVTEKGGTVFATISSEKRFVVALESGNLMVGDDVVVIGEVNGDFITVRSLSRPS